MINNSSKANLSYPRASIGYAFNELSSNSVIQVNSREIKIPDQLESDLPRIGKLKINGRTVINNYSGKRSTLPAAFELVLSKLDNDTVVTRRIFTLLTQNVLEPLALCAEQEDCTLGKAMFTGILIEEGKNEDHHITIVRESLFLLVSRDDPEDKSKQRYVKYRVIFSGNSDAFYHRNGEGLEISMGRTGTTTSVKDVYKLNYSKKQEGWLYSKDIIDPSEIKSIRIKPCPPFPRDEVTKLLDERPLQRDYSSSLKSEILILGEAASSILQIDSLAINSTSLIDRNRQADPSTVYDTLIKAVGTKNQKLADKLFALLSSRITTPLIAIAQRDELIKGRTPETKVLASLTQITTASERRSSDLKVKVLRELLLEVSSRKNPEDTSSTYYVGVRVTISGKDQDFISKNYENIKIKNAETKNVSSFEDIEKLNFTESIAWNKRTMPKDEIFYITRMSQTTQRIAQKKAEKKKEHKIVA